MKNLYKNNNKYLDLNKSKAVEDFSFFLKCATVSNIDQSLMDFNEFKKIHNYIFANFPFILRYSTYEIINDGSIFFCIKGKNEELDALILMGHLDVVPPIQIDKWEYDPFSGKVTDKYIYGRGALDMKHIDVAVLESVEYILEHNGIPDRTIYICFGHDEETLGMKGQWCIKNRLKELGVKVGMVIDEGGDYVDGIKYGSSSKLMLVQMMEKGYLDIYIEGTSIGGHSSHPGKTTALSNVARAITRIEDNPFKPKLNESLISFYKTIKDTIIDEELKQLVLDIDNNPDVLAEYLAKNDELNPLVQTTVAATMISSDSNGANVLPQYVKATINLRLSSSDCVEDAYNYIKNLCSDIDVKISMGNAINASKISNHNSKEFSILKQIINDSFNDCIVAPFITIGGTDCCFYNELSDNCFRFCPIIVSDDLNSGVHGINEHCEIDAYINGIKFYIDLINKYCF